MKLISLTDVSPSAENYSKLFNFVVGSNLKQHMHSSPSSKTATQVAVKLAHFGKKKRSCLCTSHNGKYGIARPKDVLSFS